MDNLAELLDLIDGHVGRAVTAVDADGGCSPVLTALVKELARKWDSARAALIGGAAPHDVLVELEQAADSARVAATADPDAGPATTKLVELAREALRELKAAGASPS
jgi:hypothetical protein